MTEAELDDIEAHAYGGLPPGDGEHHVHALLAEVRRLEAAVAKHRGIHAAWADRREGWEEATFAADYELWTILEPTDER
jgi:hypothetical protein